MKLRLRLLSAVTLTGVMLSAGMSAAGQPLGTGATIHGQEAEQSKALPVVNQDQFEGKWKQFKGELKEKWANFTEDDLLAIEGRVDKLEGKIQERYGDRREEVKDWIDEWFDAHGVRKDSTQS